MTQTFLPLMGRAAAATLITARATSGSPRPVFAPVDALPDRESIEGSDQGDAPRPPSSPRSSVSAVDIALLVFLGAVWGAAFLFFRIAAPVVGPIWTAEIRIALAGIALAVVVGPAAFRSIRGRVRQVALVGATFSAIPFTLLSIAALTLPASLESLLMATTPLFTALVSSAWIGQRLTRPMVVGLAIGFGAVAVLLGGAPIAITPATILAFGAGLGAALSYAVAGTYVRRAVADIPPLHLATGQLVLGALLLLPVAFLSGTPGTPIPAAIESLITMAILSTAIAWPIFFRISRQTNPTAASTVTFIVPMFGVLWGGVFLGESIGPGLLAGFGLVLLSLILVLRLPFPIGRVRLVGRVGRVFPARASAAARP